MHRNAYRAEAHEDLVEKHEHVTAQHFGEIVQRFASIIANTRLGVLEQKQHRWDEFFQVQVSVLRQCTIKAIWMSAGEEMKGAHA